MKKQFFIPFFLLFISSAFSQSTLFKNGHWGFGGAAGINYFDGDLKPTATGMLKSILTSPSGAFELEYYANDILSLGLAVELNWLNQMDENEITNIFLENVYPYVSVDLLTSLRGEKSKKWNVNALLGVGMGATLRTYYRHLQVYPDANNIPADNQLDPHYISENSAGTMIRDKDAAYAIIRPGVGIEYKLSTSRQIGLRMFVNFTNSDKLETVPRSNMNDQIESLQVTYKYLILNEKGKHASNVKKLEPVIVETCCNELDAYRDQLKAMKEKLQKLEVEKLDQDKRIQELEERPVPKAVAEIQRVKEPQDSTGLSLETLEVLDRAMKGVQFNVNTAELRDVSIPILNQVVKIMNENDALKLHIKGHTSSDGDDQINMLLSEARAKAVMDYLISNGVGADRLDSKGYGETNPIADNQTIAGRIKNRRVEFEIWY